MTRPEIDAEVLLAALREDLPTERDEARVRRRLAVAGVTVGAGLGLSNLAHSAVNGAAVNGAAANGAGASLAPAASLPGVVGTAKAASVFSSVAGIGLGGKSLIAVATVASLATYPAVSWWSGARLEPAALGLSRPHAAGPPPEVNVPFASSVVAVEAPPAKEEGPRGRGTPIAPETRTPEGESALGKSPLRGKSSLPGKPVELAAASASNPATSVSPAKRAQHEGVYSHVSSEAEASRLKDETALIERALLAVRKRDAAAAKRWLSEHERRFPAGMLSRERERLRVQLQ